MSSKRIIYNYIKYSTINNYKKYKLLYYTKMPILKTIFLYVIPGFMATTYAVFRLENKLPLASRRMG